MPSMYSKYLNLLYLSKHKTCLPFSRSEGRSKMFCQLRLKGFVYSNLLINGKSRGLSDIVLKYSHIIAFFHSSVARGRGLKPTSTVLCP